MRRKREGFFLIFQSDERDKPEIITKDLRILRTLILERCRYYCLANRIPGMRSRVEILILFERANRGYLLCGMTRNRPLQGKLVEMYGKPSGTISVVTKLQFERLPGRGVQTASGTASLLSNAK